MREIPCVRAKPQQISPRAADVRNGLRRITDYQRLTTNEDGVTSCTTLTEIKHIYCPS